MDTLLKTMAASEATSFPII